MATSETVPQERDPGRSPMRRSPVVERAKGLLMFRYGIPSFEAFALVLRFAREQGVDPTTAAERLVEGIELREPGDG
jgi:AmiR/NasT family two-component response regulator